MSLIKDYRMQNNMKQEELAAKIGVERSAISHWEHARRCPHLRALRQLSQLTGFSEAAIWSDINARRQI